MGYDQNTKGYRIWFPEKNKISIHRDVVFTKKQSLTEGMSEPIEQAEIKVDNALDGGPNGRSDQSNPGEQEQPHDPGDDDSDPELTDADDSSEDGVKQTNEDEQNRGYGLRDRSTLKAPERYSWKSFLNLIAESGEPVSYEEATTCSEATNWVKAMNEEIDSLKQNETWTLVDPPTDHPIIAGLTK